MPEIAVVINASGAIKGAKKVTKAFGSIANKGRSLISGVFSPMNAAIAALGGGAALVGITRITDQFTSMALQLEFATGSAEEAARVEEQLYQVSRRTGTSIKDNTDAYVKLTQAQAMTNLSGDDNLKVLEGLNTLMIKTGTTGVQASAAMLQLSQALTSGKLAGDEFRSMAENAPGVLNAMGEAMGIARSELKQMATDGELTSERLGKALLKIAEDGEDSMTELPKTVARGWNSVVLAFQNAWNQIDDKTGIMSFLFEALEGLATWIEDNTWRFSQWIESLMVAIQTNWPAIKSSIDEMWTKMIGFMESIGDQTPGMLQSITSISNVLITLIGWIGKAAIGFAKLLESYNAWKGVQAAKGEARAQLAFSTQGDIAAGHSLSESSAAHGISEGLASNLNNYYITTPVNKDITRGLTEEQSRQESQL